MITDGRANLDLEMAPTIKEGEFGGGDGESGTVIFLCFRKATEKIKQPTNDNGRAQWWRRGVWHYAGTDHQRIEKVR